MLQPATTPRVTREDMIERARALAPRFAERAQAAEDARRIPPESVKEMLDAGFARILLPTRVGGYGLGLDTWFDVTRELSKADASHGWCAALITHHAHVIGQFSEQGQNTVWANGPDVAIAGSFAPVVTATPAAGGYRISSKASPFASGVDHSTWSLLNGLTHDGPKPEMKFFLVPSSAYSVRDTWFTAGMRGTGSKTIVTDDVFVPDGLVLKLTDLRDGTGPGSALTSDVIHHTSFFYFAPLTFAAPMLGAAQGAYEYFRDWIRTRKTLEGTAMVEKVSVQVRMARAAADIDAAELLLRRAAAVTDAPEAYSPALLARSVRDFGRATELAIAAIDALLAMSGAAGFASSHPIQRAWRDIHFMSMHMSLNTEANFTHFGRMEFGLGSDGSRPFI
jgi:3-hydroxy-9,10-secoandrosta-1,3,5(10)-triene-9,17-dione monooxygenase